VPATIPTGARPPSAASAQPSPRQGRPARPPPRGSLAHHRPGSAPSVAVPFFSPGRARRADNPPGDGDSPAGPAPGRHAQLRHHPPAV